MLKSFSSANRIAWWLVLLKYVSKCSTAMLGRWLHHHVCTVFPELLRVRKDKEQLIEELEEQRLTMASLKARITAMEMEHQKLVKVRAFRMSLHQLKRPLNQLTDSFHRYGRRLYRGLRRQALILKLNYNKNDE